MCNTANLGCIIILIHMVPVSFPSSPLFFPALTLRVRQTLDLTDRLSASAGLYYDLSGNSLAPWGSLTYRLDPDNPKSKSRLGTPGATEGARDRGRGEYRRPLAACVRCWSSTRPVLKCFYSVA